MMKTVMVRYKVKADQAAENIRLIGEVFEQLKREKPAGLLYASFTQPDGLSFVHIATHDAALPGNPLTAFSAFKAFSAQIKDRCQEPPVPVELTNVGAYNFFQD